MTFPGWDRMLLGALGLSPTPERLRFLHAWQALEGGQAAYNPFNTTLRLSGSTNYNSAGVQHYGDAIQGICGTLLTLRLRPYAALRAALGAHGLTALQMAQESVHALDTWGTGGQKVVRMLQDHAAR